jgi:hypothetical protein
MATSVTTCFSRTGLLDATALDHDSVEGLRTVNALDYFKIQNLIYRYPDLLDRGNLDQASALFEHAEFHLEGQPEPLSRPGQNRMTQVFQEWIRLFAQRGGRPDTRHVTSKLIIEKDGLNSAIAQSYVVVVQSDGTMSIQTVMGAAYCDKFEKIQGHWRFAEWRLSPFGPN